VLDKNERLVAESLAWLDKTEPRKKMPFPAAKPIVYERYGRSGRYPALSVKLSQKMTVPPKAKILVDI
jgi:hypothetical protein